jgi:dTDP-4-dehydrorhamnose reductase
LNILVIGASGQLGKTIVPLLKENHNVDCPEHGELDITNVDSIEEYYNLDNNRIDKNYNILLLLAGIKDQGLIEKNSISALETNILGVGNIVKFINNYDPSCKIVYISTEYVYDGLLGHYKEDDAMYPQNKYGWSKLGGECCIKMLDEKQYLLIRCAFSTPPWHKDFAYVDQYSSRQDITSIAKKIYFLIDNNAYGTYNIGNPKRSVWEYAQSISDKKIDKAKIKEGATVNLPVDTSLNITKFNKFVKKIIKERK